MRIPDLSDARLAALHLQHLWADQPGKFFCVSTKAEGGKWKDHFFARDRFDGLREFIRRHEDYDVFACPHGFSSEARKEECSVPPNLLYADLDGADPRNISLRPTIALESSPGRWVGFWRTDGPAPKALNHRLTDAVGADSGGWGLTKVLRVPFTRNYKYDAAPRVRVLWDDGRVYPLPDLEQRLTTLLTPPKRRPPAHLARLIKNGAPPGQRSEKFMAVVAGLKAAGWSVEQIDEALETSPLAARYIDQGRLTEEVERCFEKAEDESAGDLVSIRADQVTMQRLEWLWPGRFAVGKIGLIAGPPDVGKSQITTDMGARITRGGEWPCDEGRAPHGCVLILSGEDDPADTLVPRLAAAGADLKRVHIVKCVRDDGEDRLFSLLNDLDGLERLIREVGDVRLVVIDPISSYLGVKQIDSFRATDVRAVLTPVAELAARTRIAFIAVMHFNKNASVTNALNRFSDSVAFGAAARHAYAVIKEEGTDRRLFLRAKNNLAPDSVPGLAYRLVGATVGDGISVSRVEWEALPVNVTADEALAANNRSEEDRTGKADAMDFLRDELADGPQPAEKLRRKAEAMSLTNKNLRDARTALRVITTKAGFGGGWVWALPEGAREGAHS